MRHNHTLILNNIKNTRGYFFINFQSPVIVQKAFPGQFLHIKCSDKNNPILRRPLSIHRIIGGKYVELLFKVVGEGTDWLSRRKKGDKIDCLGPLGNGFTLPEDRGHPEKFKEFPGLSPRNLYPWNAEYSRDFSPRNFFKLRRGKIPEGKTEDRKILVAGGIGIAPLFFLAEKLAKSKIIVFLGAKTKDEILCVDKLKKLGAEVNITTEDGSLGSKGLVSNLLRDNLASALCSPRLPNPGGQVSSVVYACGPKGMLKEIALISEENKIPCQVSFEQFMGCGIGICNACVIKTKQGYKKVCKDGPVFNAEEIDWDKI